MKNRKLYGVSILFLIGVLSYYFFLNPESDSQYFLGCPFQMATGYQCPGCGSQRALHELLHFHFLEALKFNPLFVLAIPYVVILVFTGYKKEKYRGLRKVLLSNKILLILLVISILFGIIRNL